MLIANSYISISIVYFLAFSFAFLTACVYLIYRERVESIKSRDREGEERGGTGRVRREEGQGG